MSAITLRRLVKMAYAKDEQSGGDKWQLIQQQQQQQQMQMQNMTAGSAKSNTSALSEQPIMNMPNAFQTPQMSINEGEEEEEDVADSNWTSLNTFKSSNNLSKSQSDSKTLVLPDVNAGNEVARMIEKPHAHAQATSSTAAAANAPSISSSMWRCFTCLCCCCAKPPQRTSPNVSSSVSSSAGDAAPNQHNTLAYLMSTSSTAENKKRKTKSNNLDVDMMKAQMSAHSTQSDNGVGGPALALEMGIDDSRTYKSQGSRIRRPTQYTQYTTVTNDEDATINIQDVAMWDQAFGAGASGRVFKAFYMPLCQVIACKITSRLDNTNVKAILHEYELQEEFLPESEHLMRIHGWFRLLSSNDIGLALEYMDMGSVYDSCFRENKAPKKKELSGHQQIHIDKLSYDQIRYIARESLLGLYAMHSNSPPLLHRDIKPQNILLSSFGSVKIADFGLLTALRNGKPCTDQKGTAKYFSPERMHGSYGTLSDIWSLGVALIEMYRQELIDAEDLDWFKVSESGIEIDDFLPATIPTEFADFLKNCLKSQPAQRWSAKQLLSHQFITRKWGNPLHENGDVNALNANMIHVTFHKQSGDKALLDKLLAWLEIWILVDHESNAKLFLEGDSEYLKQCVANLSKYTGLSTQFIDKYVAELYKANTLEQER